MALLTTGLSVAHAGDAIQKNANDNLMASGQWQDPKTGLIWMRCSVGQKWTGSSCSGETSELTWQEAKEYVSKFNKKTAFAGERTWRLPTIAELSSLRTCSRGWLDDTNEIPDGRGGQTTVPSYCKEYSSRPTLDTRIFPNTPVGVYWSSSPNVSYGSNAWGVNFSRGSDGYVFKDLSYRARLVRTQ